MRACWCGNSKLLPFGSRYGECRACGTLVYLEEQPPERFMAGDDPLHLYGKQYWLGRQQDLYGFADIHARVRSDLAERNLHWLKTLLKYRLPPARVLELGCAHGSFVSLMSHAGFDALGAEMSPWVVEFARQTFGIDVRTGPIETLDIAPGSLDVIALMDVLEHLPDPVATMRRCLERLRPGGLLLIQTPEYKPEIGHDELVRGEAPFLDQLKPDEHLYLLSRRSAEDLFRRLGARWIRFEPAIFAQYDMFFVVAREALPTFGEDEIRDALAATANGRLTTALLDLREREVDLQRRYREADSDRVARATQIESLTGLIRELEADRVARGEQVVVLSRTLEAAEALSAEHAARLESVGEQLRTSDADRADRGRQIETLARIVEEAEADRSARGEQIKALSGQLSKVEADRADRALQIDALTGMVRIAEADRAARGEQIKALSGQLSKVEADRADRALQIDALTDMVRVAEADRAARGEQIVTLTRQLHEVEADRADRGRQIELLGELLSNAAIERARLEAQLVAVAADLAQAVADRTALAGEIAATNAQLEPLLRRRGFRWMARFAGWREAKRLAELLKVSP